MNISFDLDSITEKILEDFRKVTDPLADNTVKNIIESGYEKQINEIFMTLVRSSSYDETTFSGFDAELSIVLNDYFRKSSILPEWADQSKIKIGEQVFITYGPEVFMLLNMSSLPMCYTCAKGAQVLYETGRLLSHNSDIDPLARRLMETAQMIVNVMAPGGLSPNGMGVVTIQKIRLIHASIRYFLKEGQYKNTPWDTSTYGEPINQEDLAGTLMSFGPVILSGLKQLNVELSESETDAYMHCWKIVGHLMGIQSELLPDTYEQGFELASKILNHQAAESEAGKALTESCIDYVNHITPGNAFRNVPSFMMDFFLEEFSKASGKDLSSFIGIQAESNRKDKIALSLTKYIVGKISHLEHHLFIRKVSSVFNRLLLQGIIHHFNGGKKVYFSIPPSLQKSWRVEKV
ncbi:MAG: oxygenase MpaB family protein [Bacteroidota bacterium]